MRKEGERVDFEHPGNAAVLACLDLLERTPGYVRSAPRGTADEWELGTHPDLVSLLWDDVDAALPKRCAWIVHGRPALVRPKVGLVFGFATGTLPIVLRIPTPRHAELGLAESSQLGAHLACGARCEPDWIVAPFTRVAALARIAFDAAS